MIAFGVLFTALLPVGSHADAFRKLAGPQIGAKLAGMEFSDEVHWREVYERNGTMRSYDMGRKRIGKWRVTGNQFCIDAESTGEEECYEIWIAEHKLEMRREATSQATAAGILRKPTDSTITPGKQ
jgi:hypothetical protein